jgi:hypothetical protein
MRRKVVFGLGLAGVLTSAGAGVAQVTPPVSPELPPGVRPAGSTPPGGAYVPPTGGVGASAANPFGGIAPAATQPPPAPPEDLTINSALGLNHPWAVTPETGPYFICVKSYSRPSRPKPGDNGPSARAMAEELATEIRDLHRVQAFLYEYISDERRAEAASIAAARERARIFAGQLDKYRQEAQLKGMAFLDDDRGRIRVHYKTVNYNDQIAVLVGPFQTDKDAREALETLRKWPSPKNPNLMDSAAYVHQGRDGKPVAMAGHLNPYLTAHVVPNPAVQHSQPIEIGAGVDPFIVKLNEGRPYSLLKATKGWTLGVKSFCAPVQIVSKDSSSDTGIMGRLGLSKGADVLKAGAEQAEQLVAALRAMKDAEGRPLGLEAFVLHTRNASLVTIGQFDGPNDPALLQTKQLLTSMRLNVTEDQTGLKPVANAPSLFETMIPVPIPHPK